MVLGRLANDANAAPSGLLDAARMVGVGVTAGLGQFLVDTPMGLFGEARQTTTLGLAFAATMFGGSLLCGLATVLTRSANWTRWLFAALVVAGVTVFLPALMTDLGVAAAIVGWQLIVLTRLLAAGETRGRGPRRPSTTHGRTVSHVLLLSLFITTLIVGFGATDAIGGLVVCLVLDALAIGGALAVFRPAWKRVAGWAALALALVILALVSGLQPLTHAIATLGLVQVALLVVALRDGPAFDELVEQFLERPALLVLSTFAFVAIAGAVLLTFPAASTGDRIGPLDALFTSVSATCVTGLIVVDTPTAFSGLGEAIILVLIQVGGLGMMVLSTFGTVILGGRLTLRGERALGQLLELTTPGHAYRLVRFIVAATLATEAIGAALLTVSFVQHGVAPADAVWRGVFHSVSAFCNAGFALQTDSIVMFASDPLALAVHGVLIVVGGLGFVVLAWIWSRWIRRVPGRAPVQVHVVLWLSGLLVGAGAVLYAALEWHASLADLSWPDKLFNAVFQSITMRTAGFNSVDLTQMHPATLLLMLGFMFVGAAPGGTGGGIKVTTVAVLAAAIPNLIGARASATLFGRSVPAATLQRAATIAVVASATAGLALFVLLITEDAPFSVLAFETISALGTVGLSLGVTGSLTAIGKVVILATMFIGRVGPLTLALALGRRTRPVIGYPESRIMVG